MFNKYVDSKRNLDFKSIYKRKSSALTRSSIFFVICLIYSIYMLIADYEPYTWFLVFAFIATIVVNAYKRHSLKTAKNLRFRSEYLEINEDNENTDNVSETDIIPDDDKAGLIDDEE